MKNCLVYLIDDKEDDIADFSKSIGLVEKNLVPFCEPFDIIVFHEENFYPFKDLIKTNFPIIYKEIKFELPNYPEEILKEIPELYPHPTHQNGPIAYWHKGFPMGYRHMCKFFFCDILKYISHYDSYMRLDSDSFILDPVSHDIFNWFNSNKLDYAYIEPAVQIDNQLVCQGLNETVSKWLEDESIKTIADINKIQNGTLYYTNFEMCRVFAMISKESRDFYTFINKTGKIFSKRWGDHILRYLQVNLFFNPDKVKPVAGIHYQHGAIYKT